MNKDYISSLKYDLIEQFKDKEKILALIEVLGKQLNDLFAFYEQLRKERNVNTAIGKQLDGVGDIVVLSRPEAGTLTGDDSLPKSLDDEIYRKYLIYKILKNTCKCTYYDIMEGANMFWEGPPLKYSESADLPATIQFEFDAHASLTEQSFVIPFIKAGGVGLKMTMRKTDNTTIYVGLTKQEAVSLTIGCNEAVLPEVTFLANEDGLILVDDYGAWVAL